MYQKVIGGKHREWYDHSDCHREHTGVSKRKKDQEEALAVVPERGSGGLD
jgi:hypothetical protein